MDITLDSEQSFSDCLDETVVKFKDNSEDSETEIVSDITLPIAEEIVNIVNLNSDSDSEAEMANGKLYDFRQIFHEDLGNAEDFINGFKLWRQTASVVLKPTDPLAQFANQKVIMAAQLKGEAQRWYFEHAEAIDNAENFTKLFLERFSNEPSPPAAMTYISSVRAKENEDMEKFLVRFKRNGKVAEIPDSLLFNFLLRAIPQRFYQAAVTAQCKTYSKLAELILHVHKSDKETRETTFSETKEKPSVSFYNAITAEQTDIDESEDIPDENEVHEAIMFLRNSRDRSRPTTKDFSYKKQSTDYKPRSDSLSKYKSRSDSINKQKNFDRNPRRERSNSKGRSKSFDKSRMRCHNCGELGHIKYECTKPTLKTAYAKKKLGKEMAYIIAACKDMEMDPMDLVPESGDNAHFLNGDR